MISFIKFVPQAAGYLLLVACSGSTGRSPELMSWAEYRSISHVVPYVLDISVGEGRLVYVGTHHTNDPSHLDIDVIEALWEQTEPEVAYEGGGRS